MNMQESSIKNLNWKIFFTDNFIQANSFKLKQILELIISPRSLEAKDATLSKRESGLNEKLKDFDFKESC
jgi:hypothetical protein